MTLDSLIDRLAGSQRSIRVFGPEPVPELADHFESTNVTVEHVPLEAAEDCGFVTVREGDRFVGGAGIEAVQELVDPTVTAPWGERRRAGEFRALFDLLTGVTFAGFERRQMLAVSREIEDRAWRLDDGELHATFTGTGELADQASVYERLATRDGLAVHVYLPAGDSGSDVDHAPASTAVHTVDPATLDDVWTVAYLGGDPVHATALVGSGTERSAPSGAERDGRLPDGFVGVWTDDRAKVETVIESVRRLAA